MPGDQSAFGIPVTKMLPFHSNHFACQSVRRSVIIFVMQQLKIKQFFRKDSSFKSYPQTVLVVADARRPVGFQDPSNKDAAVSQ